MLFVLTKLAGALSDFYPYSPKIVGMWCAVLSLCGAFACAVAWLVLATRCAALPLSICLPLPAPGLVRFSSLAAAVFSVFRSFAAWTCTSGWCRGSAWPTSATAARASCATPPVSARFGAGGQCVFRELPPATLRARVFRLFLDCTSVLCAPVPVSLPCICALVVRCL